MACNFLSKRVQVSCRFYDLSAALWMSQVPQGISKSTRHWCISTWILSYDLQGKNVKSNMRMLSCRKIIFRFWFLPPNVSYFHLYQFSLARRGKKKKRQWWYTSSISKPFVNWIASTASAQLFPKHTQLQLGQRTSILHPSIVRIQKHPRWTSFLLSQKHNISHIMVLVATRNSADSFQKEPSQITAAWIMEQKLQERESVTEGSLIL